MSPAVEFRSVSRHFGPANAPVKAVDGVDLTIAEGSFFAMLGPSGSGKTTCLRLISGFEKPTSGSIRIFGLDFWKHRIEILRQVNFSSAYTALPSNLLVWQNLTVFAKLYGIPRPKQRIEELLELLDITHLRKSVNGTLSAGESTRVNLAKALLNKPRLLLLDEPTASLDPDIADRVRKLLRKLQQERGLSILYTSHNMRDIEEVCDRLIFLHGGKVLAEGTPGEVHERFHRSSLEDLFIGVARGEIDAIGLKAVEEKGTTDGRG